MQAKGILFSEMTPDVSWEDTFNDWYDEEHIPLRMDVPGFVGAQRYHRSERNYLAVYDMAGPEVLSSKAYGQIKNHPSVLTSEMLNGVSGFTRYIGREIGTQHNVPFEEMLQASVLYPVFFQVPEDRLKAFDEWYDKDHVPTLLETSDWLGCRRFALEIAHPQPFNRLALHYIRNRDALESDARTRARESSWRAELAKEDWFKGTYMLFNRQGARFIGNKPQCP